MVILLANWPTAAILIVDECMTGPLYIKHVPWRNCFSIKHVLSLLVRNSHLLMFYGNLTHAWLYPVPRHCNPHTLDCASGYITSQLQPPPQYPTNKETNQPSKQTYRTHRLRQTANKEMPRHDAPVLAVGVGETWEWDWDSGSSKIWDLGRTWHFQ